MGRMKRLHSVFPRHKGGSTGRRSWHCLTASRSVGLAAPPPQTATLRPSFVNARGGHGQEEPGAVHTGEGGGAHKAELLAIACGKLGLVGMSKTQIETFKPPSADDLCCWRWCGAW